MKKLSASLLMLAIAWVLLLSGCGGGNTKVAPSASTGTSRGQMKITVQWPKLTRLIPSAAQSINISIGANGQNIVQKLVARPADGTDTTIRFDNLPTVTVTLIATAYPNTDGTGTIQASGSTVVAVPSNDIVNASLTMNSTITQVSVAPTMASVMPAQSTQLIATAKDAQGNVVLVAPSKWLWNSSNPSIGSVTSGSDHATLTGTTLGMIMLTVTETESGKSTQVTASVTAASGLANSAWPKFRGDILNTGRGGGAGAAGTLKWSTKLNPNIYSSPTIAPDGTVYIGSDDGNFYALSGANGNIRWTFPANGRVISSAAIGKDGTIVYIGGSGAQKVYALDGATGTKKWEFPVGAWVGSSPSIDSDGTVYVGAKESNRLYALNGTTGQEKWEFAANAEIFSCPAIGANGLLYIGSFDGKVYALNKSSGAKVWEFATGDQVWSSVAIAADGTVYFGSWDKKIYAVDGTSGVKKWEFSTGDQVWSSAALGIDGTVYIGSYDGKVYALNGATGAKVWDFQTGGPIRSSPAIGSDGTIYIGSHDNRLYALDGASGSERWHYTTGNIIFSSPAVSSDGTIYFGSFDGSVYAVK